MRAYLSTGEVSSVSVRDHDVGVPSISHGPVEKFGNIVPLFQIPVRARRFDVPKDVPLIWRPLCWYLVQTIQPEGIVEDDGVKVFYVNTRFVQVFTL